MSHHLNKQGGPSGARAIRTRADVLLEGSDTAKPVFVAEGRTIRSKDPIRTPFSIAVAHEHDEDDRVAKSLVRAVFAGESGLGPEQSPSAQRVLDVLGKAGGPMTERAIRDATGLGGSRVKGPLEELRGKGKINREGRAWSITSSAFFDAYNARAGRTAGGDSDDPVQPF